jgi:hypothetical protein
MSPNDLIVRNSGPRTINWNPALEALATTGRLC